MQAGPAILLAAIFIQLAAVVTAVWLIGVTGRKWAWALVATGLGVMLVLRSFRLYMELLGQKPPDPYEESLSLFISVLFLSGLLGIGPLFRANARLAEELRTAHSELEQRVRDRTAELAAANEGLQQERYLLDTLMDYLPHNIYFKDADSRFIRVNKAMARYVGVSDPHEAIGKSDLDFFTDEHALQALHDEREIVRTGEGIVTKVEKETWPDGRTTWASSTKLPLLDDAGHIVGTFGISQDITAQMLDAEALRTAKETAEAASRAKSTFLANMSHEIRTPLNAVIGMTELVLKSQLSQQQREYLSTVRDSGEALLRVINDILDFSKIEAEKLVLEQERFHLRESLGDTMKSFALRAHQQGLELACQIRHDVPSWLVGDYNRLRQVVVNLVNNAIKFTHRGEVVVEAACESSTAEDVTLHFTVSDTGIGIPQEKHELVFGMFEQADSSTTRRHGGTGLGLAIAARLVNLMGGKIWLESEVGHGTRFHFTVRLGRGEPVPAAGELDGQLDGEPACLHGMRVLVVDDNATNRRILHEVLASWRMVPTTVATAEEALDLVREADRDGQPYPLVITDAHMPEFDGFMLAGEIREHRRTDGPRTDGPVIMMLTSGDRPSDVAECQRLGISAYLLKPIKQSELLEAIQMALGLLGARSPQPCLAAKGLCHDRRLRILLAEDSLVNQQLAVALLSGEGHEVVVVNNGREAVAAVEVGRFDLVLMDVQMPDMDGLEATAIIRRNESARDGRRLPIIAMTAHALTGDRQRCLEAGMDGYTSKPINADELFAAIAELTAARNNAARVAGARHAIDADADPVDWPAALNNFRGDILLLDTIVETAVAEIPNLLATIRASVTGDDPKTLHRAAHTLKGSVRYFGAGRVIDLAARLESLGQTGNLHAAREVLPALGDASDLLLASLARRLAATKAHKSPPMPEPVS
jgi:two-component system sensor histidine kinase/response regulator